MLNNRVSGGKSADLWRTKGGKKRQKEQPDTASFRLVSPWYLSGISRMGPCRKLRLGLPIGSLPAPYSLLTS